jgi:flavin reductase (DIM6/NTAB) family NADH-FMN oxidoreductase RutF
MVQATRAADFSTPDFRKALGNFPTGVTIITTRAQDGTAIGLTASSFNSVSLTPPLVLWSLGLQSRNLSAFQNCSHYAISVLSQDQTELAMRFASNSDNRFNEIDFRDGLHGAPILANALASFECFNRSRYTEGDHIIFVGEVERFTQSSGAPLIYHRGQFGQLKS